MAHEDNVDANMTRIVQAPTHQAALTVARGMTRGQLWDLADLNYITDLPDGARPLTVALRVVVEGRGLDTDEARALYATAGQRFPRMLAVLI